MYFTYVNSKTEFLIKLKSSTPSVRTNETENKIKFAWGLVLDGQHVLRVTMTTFTLMTHTHSHTHPHTHTHKYTSARVHTHAHLPVASHRCQVCWGVLVGVHLVNPELPSAQQAFHQGQVTLHE